VIPPGTATDALADGRLADAIALQRQAVSRQPDDATARLFLFELLTLAGRLLDARQELLDIPSTAPTWPASRLAFRRLLSAVRRRGRIRKPAVFGPPPKHLKYRWLAAQAARAGDLIAADLADRADLCLPEVSGFVDGRGFTGLRDSDDRFAGVFEMFVGRRWVWVPLEQVRTLTLNDPAGSLDLAFRPGTLRLADGRQFAVTVPLVYPSSDDHGDDFALGQTVDWTEAGGLTCGLGAKVLTAGDEEVAFGECKMFEIRTVC
jgi:type VI secretion system protein ImpE